MATALNINDYELERKQVVFSTNVIGAINNIPNIVILVLSLPFVLIAIAILRFTLPALVKKGRKLSIKLKEVINQFDYEEAKEFYSDTLYLSKRVNLLLEQQDSINSSVLLKRISKSIVELGEVVNDVENTISSVLFYKSTEAKLTEKQAEGLDYLNDVWGDDADETYAKNTHHHLKKCI